MITPSSTAPSRCFILLAGTARAGIVSSDLLLHLTLYRCRRLILVRSGYLSYLLTLNLLLDTYMHEHFYGLPHGSM